MQSCIRSIHLLNVFRNSSRHIYRVLSWLQLYLNFQSQNKYLIVVLNNQKSNGTKSGE